MSKLKEGYVQIYTGNGKGKTTAAVGLATRAAGNEYMVYMVQFLKTGATGEIESAKKLSPYFNIFRFQEVKGFFWNLNEEEKKQLKIEVKKTFDFCLDAIENRKCDILIMDEVMGTLSNDLLSEDEIIALIDKKPKDMELIMTGRNVPERIAEKANLITEMKEVKHYFKEGVPARKGIEF